MYLRFGSAVLFLAAVSAVAAAGGRPEPPRQRPAHPQDAREGELDAAMDFFREFSPKRFEAYCDMSEPRQAKYRGAIVARYRAYQWVVKDSPRLKEIKERQLRAEDAIFDLSRRLEAEESEQDKEALKAELRKKVEELVDARLAEREVRIERLAKLLNVEQESLQRDKQAKQREQSIERRYNEILTAGQRDQEDDAGLGMRERGGRPGRPER